MANNFYKFANGINLRPTTASPTQAGDLVYDSVSNLFKFYNGTSVLTFSTNSDIATFLRLDGTNSIAGDLLWSVDDTYDIGSADSGATLFRPHNVYFAGGLAVGTNATAVAFITPGYIFSGDTSSTVSTFTGANAAFTGQPDGQIGWYDSANNFGPLWGVVSNVKEVGLFTDGDSLGPFGGFYKCIYFDLPANSTANLLWGADGDGNIGDTAGHRPNNTYVSSDMFVGNGIQIKEGTNRRMGVVTLVGGTATVSNTSVTASTRIFLTVQSPGGTLGAVYVSSRVAGTSFTITSLSAIDTSTIAWQLIEPSAVPDFSAYSVVLNGSNQYIDYGTNASININYATTAATFGAWIYPTNNSTLSNIISNAEAASGFKGLMFLLGADISGAGTLEVYMSNTYNTNDLTIYTNAGVIPANVWSHVVVTTDGTGTAAGTKIYVNGVSVTVNTFHNNLSGQSTVSTNSFKIGSGTFGGKFPGKIDEAFIINGTALSAGQITAIYGNSHPSSLAQYSPTSWWRFENNFTDTQGTNNGTGQNAPTFSSIVP